MFLRCAVHDTPKTWKKWLPLAELWYNSSEHASIGCSPFKALYGVEPNLGAMPLERDTPESEVGELLAGRKEQLDKLKTHLAAAQNRMKMQA